MDGLLIAVTVFSLVLAAVMSAVAWALLRNERKRSAARAEALESLAFASPSRDRRLQTADVPALTARRGVDISGDAETEETDFDLPIRDMPRKDDRGIAAPWGGDARGTARGHEAGDVRTSSPAEEHRQTLARARRHCPRGGRLDSRWPLPFGRRNSRPRSKPRAPPLAKPCGEGPRQLQSLRHAADAQGLFTVTGLVENPREGVERDEVEAVVYLFDDEGKFFASGRAPLEVSRLLPGDQSPFVVTDRGPHECRALPRRFPPAGREAADARRPAR